MVHTVNTILAIPGIWPHPPGPFILGKHDGFLFAGLRAQEPETGQVFSLRFQ